MRSKNLAAAVAVVAALGSGCSVEQTFGTEDESRIAAEATAEIKPTDEVTAMSLGQLSLVRAIEQLGDYPKRPYYEVTTKKLGNHEDITITVDPREIPKLSPKILEEILQSVVVVQVQNGPGEPLLAGSGFGINGRLGGSDIDVMTAGHIVYGSDEGDTTVFTNDGSLGLVDFVGINFTTSGVSPEEALASHNMKFVTDDIAMLSLVTADGESIVNSLRIRNFYNVPLLPGEVLWTVNFQRGNSPGDPAIYPLVFNGYLDNHGLPKFGEVFANVDLDQDGLSDDLLSGASGAPVVDSKGRVVGIIVGASARDDYLDCGEVLETGLSFDGLGHSSFGVVIDGTGECNKGLSVGTIRLLAPQENLAYTILGKGNEAEE